MESTPNKVQLTAAAARHAAGVLVEVYRQVGNQQDHDEYDLVWRAKEYLLNCADKMPRPDGRRHSRRTFTGET